MLQHSTPALMVRRSAILAAAFLPPRLAQNSVDEHPQGSGAVLGPPDDYNGCSLQAICGAPAQRGPRLLPIVVPGPVILKNNSLIGTKQTIQPHPPLSAIGVERTPRLLSVRRRTADVKTVVGTRATGIILQIGIALPLVVRSLP
jgi:hypothetical protein